MEFVFWITASLIAYVYLGYPVLLGLIRLIFGIRPVAIGDSTPHVTLIVSAFNEEGVIGDKIRNSLSLDYPRDLLDIVVVSDASDDGTDSIVEGFAADGVRLIRMPERGGKTVGLNEGVQSAYGEIVVFSDANALYEAAAIRMLVRNFDDAAVGAVVGESTYADAAIDADRSESSYWDYELLIKRLESQLGSVVGGDGAIYAIRKSCYQPMTADALSDFCNPLQIVQQGYRCVYEPQAVSVEDSAGEFAREFRRKVRIVNRAWRATMRMKQMLNPVSHGLFAFELISHKLLRWLVPVFLPILLLASIFVADQHPFYLIALIFQLVLYALAIIGAGLRESWNLPPFISIPYYFCLVNLASLKGIIEVYMGRSYTTWKTARTD